MDKSSIRKYGKGSTKLKPKANSQSVFAPHTSNQKAKKGITMPTSVIDLGYHGKKTAAT